MIPTNLKFLNYINPISYIVDGYRDSLLEGIWFWEKPIETIYFWIIIVALLIISNYIYKRLRPMFSDVL